MNKIKKFILDALGVCMIFAFIYMLVLFKPSAWAVGSFKDEFGDPVKTCSVMDKKNDGIIVYHIQDNKTPMIVVEIYDSVGSVGEAECYAKNDKGDYIHIEPFTFHHYDKRKKVDVYKLSGDSYYSFMKLLLNDNSFRILLVSKDESTVLRNIDGLGFSSSYAKVYLKNKK